MRLKRTKQCALCPWKQSTDVTRIPGYSRVLHEALADAIAKPCETSLTGEMKIMTCHASSTGFDEYCVGWLWNQIGVGNNINLRIRMRRCVNADKIKVRGPQHENFEDTL